MSGLSLAQRHATTAVLVPVALLAGCASLPSVDPFAYGRASSLPRLWHLMTDLRRLNHRTHNKLFVADGVVAVAGGRNLADEYFMQSKDANFIDFDLQITGALVAQLGRIFDDYWNSERVFGVTSNPERSPPAARPAGTCPTGLRARARVATTRRPS